jgi:hypothetical protein
VYPRCVTPNRRNSDTPLPIAEEAGRRRHFQRAWRRSGLSHRATPPCPLSILCQTHPRSSSPPQSGSGKSRDLHLKPPVLNSRLTRHCIILNPLPFQGSTGLRSAGGGGGGPHRDGKDNPAEVNPPPGPSPVAMELARLESVAGGGGSEQAHSTDVESPPPQRVCVSIHTRDMPCSDLGRMDVLTDPAARRRG